MRENQAKSLRVGRSGKMRPGSETGNCPSRKGSEKLDQPLLSMFFDPKGYGQIFNPEDFRGFSRSHVNLAV